MNRFGRVFNVSIFGESHGPAVGVVIDGCPPGIELDSCPIVDSLVRRRAGAPGTTARTEQDQPRILSGSLNGITTGAPLTFVVDNTDVDSTAYEQVKTRPRPGHADFVAMKRFGNYHDSRGGGHFSGRLTAGLVIAGAIARTIITPTSIEARILEIGGDTDFDRVIADARQKQDSLGALIECRVQEVPVGLGEPFFDSVESLVSHLLFAIPGVKGVEFGAGFRSARMTGSQHNDPILDREGKTASNNAGGINGGLTNGNDIIVRVAVKPASSIGLPQSTIDMTTGKPVSITMEGRHDTCFALRMPVIIESALAIVLADLVLLPR